jgi:hypothetical protein
MAKSRRHDRRDKSNYELRQKVSPIGDSFAWGRAVDQQTTPVTPCLRLATGRSYRLRFFHHPKRIFRYYWKNRSAITDSLPNAQIIMVGRPLTPLTRHVQIVIDRDSGGAIRIIEFSEALFQDLTRLCQRHDIDIGGLVAPDVVIEVSGVGIKVAYRANLAADFKPFDETEKDRLRCAIQSGLNLDLLFRPTSDITAALTGLL